MVTGAQKPLPASLLDLLVCPRCEVRLAPDVSALRLACPRCDLDVPVRAGIPRFVSRLDAIAAQTQASFGYEWTHFNDWEASGETNFLDYFGDLDLMRLSGKCVLDAGCGMGRHARMLAPHVGRLVALDFSAAIDQAAQTLAASPNVACIQADLTNPPFHPAAFDFVYSLGVLHHLQDTAGALKGLIRLVKPGGRMRVYLYWQPTGWRGRLLALVNSMRAVTTRMPFSILRVLCWALSIGMWTGIILPYRALARLGVSDVFRMPLFQYTKYPFAVLYNDQFDRFSAPLEKRYREHEVRALLYEAGLRDIRIWPRFGWIAEGVRPTDAQTSSASER